MGSGKTLFIYSSKQHNKAMSKKTFSILAFLLTFTLVAEAQQTADGRKVKRITFDREQVNIEYADGTQQQGVSTTTIRREESTTGLAAAKPTASRSARQWYTIDGRSVQHEPRQKGVYIVRDEKGIKKTIKK